MAVAALMMCFCDQRAPPAAGRVAACGKLLRAALRAGKVSERVGEGPQRGVRGENRRFDRFFIFV